jgi:hypothetical protein
VEIDFDLETTPLEIKTDSAIGSRERLSVDLYTSQRDIATRTIDMHFSSPPKYYPHHCADSWINMPTNLPTAIIKVWRVTITRTPGTRIVIHCNEVEVLNIMLSDSTCSNSDWRFWSRNVTKIWFHPSVDTASDYYRPATGNILKLFSIYLYL